MVESPPPPLVFPPLDGSLSILDIVEFNVEHNPSHPAFLFSPDDKSDTITEISHLEFARGIHRAAHIVNPDGKRKTGSVVVIIAHLDSFVYQTLVLGIIHAGLVPFPVSPRNSSAAIVHLLKSTSCHDILATPETLGGLIEDVQETFAREKPEFALEVDTAPMIDQLYPNLGKENADHSFSPYPPLHKHFGPADICLYLHSSGSTGFPKAIPLQFRNPVEWGASNLTNLRKHEPRLRLGAMALPPFHVMGFIMQVVYPICGLISVSVFPPEIWRGDDEPHPHTGDDILQQLRRTQSNSVVLIPMTLEGMVKSSNAIDYLRSLQFVAYGGASMDQGLGDSLVKSGVNLQSIYGSTEVGSITVNRPNRDQTLPWEWIEFSEYVSMRWVPQGDGTYEAQCLTTDKYHPSVENLEDTKGYAMSDLFTPHPTLERVWKIVGRKDEVIVHSSGEKTVPGPMESVMMSHSTVIIAAVMFGHGHDQVGVLVEPVAELSINTKDPIQVAEFRSKAWPSIQEANKDAPAFSKIFKEMILVASPSKPLPRSAKGTVMKKAALQLYSVEVEELYRTIESDTAGDDIAPPEAWDKHTVQVWLIEQAKDIRPTEQVDSARDLFEQGFDSLSATILRLRIAGALRQAPDPPSHEILQNIVYNYPTIDDLAGYVASFFQDHEETEEPQTSTDAIEAMIEKYSAGLKQPLEHTRPVISQSAEHVVLITGSTGNLGSQILEQLLQRSDVIRIYALSRSSKLGPALSRLQDRFKDKGLDTELLKLPKLVLLEGDLSQERLGLSADIYSEVQTSVTIVVHAAWRLDFNLTLASFEANIKGTRNLIDFVREGPKPQYVRFLYTSSIGSAQGWDPKRGPYPEEVVYDAGAAMGNGYGESKYVAERILANSGLHATSIRIGQISGGRPNGSWSTSDWVPILIKTSLVLDALPDSPADVAWLPMDVAASCILEIAFYSAPLPMAVNLVHPQPLPWSRLFSHIRELLLSYLNFPKDSLTRIPFHEWMCRLEEKKNDKSDDAPHKLPALKLPSFFSRKVYGNSNVYAMESNTSTTFATVKAQDLCPTFSELEQLSVHDADLWIKHWIDIGFI